MGRIKTTEEEAQAEISLCGAVDLLAAIFKTKVDVDKLRSHYGLPLKYRHCLNCGKTISGKRISRKYYCSKECLSKMHRVPLECPVCGKIFYRHQSRVIYCITHPQSGNNKLVENFFCSQKCLGKVAGQKYGFGKHPNHIRLNPLLRRKWNYSKVYELQDEKGWGCSRIGRALGIPTSTVSKILARGNK